MTGFEKLFRSDVRGTTADTPRRSFVRQALSGYFTKRYQIQHAYADWQAARSAASAIKFNAVNALDKHLETFTRQAEARGTKVFFASNGKQARDYVLALCQEKGVRSIVKAKTMTGDFTARMSKAAPGPAPHGPWPPARPPGGPGGSAAGWPPPGW